MIKFVFFINALCVVLCTPPRRIEMNCGPPRHYEMNYAGTLADVNTDFAWRFYKKVATNENGNIVFSPFSLSTALTMAWSGAAGDTLTEMNNALGFSSSGLTELQVLMMTRTLLRIFNADGKQYDISVANTMFGERTTVFKSQFLDDLRIIFESLLEEVDFANRPEFVRQEMNRWVEEKTNNKIKDLIPADAVNQDTILYLVNVIYFNAAWRFPFRKEHNIVNGDFFKSVSEVAKVTYMRDESRYCITRIPELRADLLEIPYEDDTVSMYILLPDRTGRDAGVSEGLNYLESHLDVNQLKNSNRSNSFSHLVNRKVDLRLPKFQMTQGIYPVKILKEMGMVKAFDESTANLSRITDTVIWISDVVHKAFINVHEGGTVAAASTGGGAQVVSVGWEFYADRPFLYFIREKTTGSILFMGRYVAPPGEDGELPRVGEMTSQGADDTNSGNVTPPPRDGEPDGVGEMTSQGADDTNSGNVTPPPRGGQPDGVGEFNPDDLFPHRRAPDLTSRREPTWIDHRPVTPWRNRFYFNHHGNRSLLEDYMAE